MTDPAQACDWHVLDGSGSEVSSQRAALGVLRMRRTERIARSNVSLPPRPSPTYPIVQSDPCNATHPAAVCRLGITATTFHPACICCQPRAQNGTAVSRPRGEEPYWADHGKIIM